MDYFDYSPLADSTKFPSVSASATNPKTLLHVHSDIVFVNVGSGWQAMAQESTNSVYSVFTGASATTQANILSSLTTVNTNPGTYHTTKATKVADRAVRGH